jgi:AcrR family transcriptional regulator
MARPIHADAQATRGRILQAASRLFSELGSGRTTMRQIAAQARVSLAMVHHYFGSKEELYRACIDAMASELGELRRALVPAFATGGDLREAIGAAVRCSNAFAQTHRPAVQLLMRTVLDAGELDRTYRDRVLLPYLDQGAALLSQRLGRPEEKVRIALLSINYLVIRFALNSAEESAAITRLPAGGTAEVDSAIAEHMVDAARALLGCDADAKEKERPPCNT